MVQKDDTIELFLDQDIAKVLSKDVALRQELALYFVKNTGSEGNELHVIKHMVGNFCGFKFVIAIKSTSTNSL